MEMKPLSALPTRLRKCVNLNISFVSQRVKINSLIEFYYAGLQKQANNLGIIRFVVILVVIRNRCESRTMNGSYEAVSGAVA